MRDRRNERGEVLTIMAVAGFAISALSAYLSYKRNKAIVKDDNPNTAVERGAWLPAVIGRRRLGPRVLWVENGGAGVSFYGPGPTTAGGKRGARRGGNYRARVWHGLCIGPASRIRRIWFNGKVVSDGDINPDYVPSGSSFQIGGVGTFRVYWGERDQPADPLLTAAFGFASGFPYMCSVVWDSMELGTVPQHPLVEYEVEVQAHASELKQSPGWLTSSITDPGAGANFDVVAHDVGLRVVEIRNDFSTKFVAQKVIRLSGAAATAIYGKSQVYCDITYTSYDGAANITLIHVGLETTRSIANPITQSGDYLALCEFADDDGVNPAHALYHILFGSWPWGCALDPAEYDIDSFEYFGTVAYFVEGLRGDIIAQDGELAEAVVAQILQDFGLALPFDVNRGKYILTRIREPNTPRAYIGRELQLPALPEIETVHNKSGQYNQLVFSFSDRTINYRDMTIVVKSDKDSLASRFVNVQEIRLSSTTHYNTARQIAIRRAQEEFGNKAKFKIYGQNDVRYMIPGIEHEAYGIPFVLRMLSNQPDSISAKTEVISYVDVFGANIEYNPETLEQGGDSHFGTPPEPSYPVPDLLVKIVEPPRYIDDSDLSIAVLRVRANSTIVGAKIWISSDDSTYYEVAYDDAIVTAVELSAVIPVTSHSVDAAGAAVGEDVPVVVEDLTGSEESWRLGRQIAIINDELMFVKSVDSDGSGGYLPKGLLRGRLGTTPAAHAIGDVMYVLPSHRIKYIKSYLIQPGKTIYVKTQPVTADGGEISLSSVEPVSITIQANAWRPIAPRNINTPGNTLSWPTGGSLTLRWRYFSTEWHKTGAGMQGAGNPTARSPVQGEFKVEFYTTGDVLKGKYVVDRADLIVPNADLVAMFTSEPSSLKVKVYNVYGGFSSTAATATLVRT